MLKRGMKNLAKTIMLPIIFAVITLLVSPQLVFASTTVTNTLPQGCKANSNGLLSSQRVGLPTYGCGSDSSIIQTVLKLVFGALALISLLFVVIGGLKYTLSGGDSNAIASAKKTIIYAVLGLALGLSVFTIISFVFGQLG